MGGELSAWLAANKPEAIGVGAAAVAGLALLARKRKAAAAPGAGGSIPGTIPAAAVVGTSGTVPGYDSSAFDAYNALQDEIGTLARNSDAAHNTGAAGSGVGAGVKVPLASTLLAPNGTGHYVIDMNGSIGELESDGSVFNVTPQQWAPYYAAGARPEANIGSLVSQYSLVQNLQARQKAAQSPAAAAAATSGA